jgi:ferritin
MLSTVMQDAINEQINAELYSAYLYLAMSAHSAAANLPGFARWMRIQGQEELGHALRFFDQVVDRGGRPTLQAIRQPPATFTGPLDIFRQTLAHEQEVTKRIHQLYGLAATEKDYASQEMLQWFIKEQVEEERSASEVLETLKLAGEQGPALIILDRQLGARQAND